MKEVEIEISNKSITPSHLEARLNFLRGLPLEVYIEEGNKLSANFEGNSVNIHPLKDIASYANFKGVLNIKGCELDMKTNYPTKVFNKQLCGGTYYYFHNKAQNKKLNSLSSQ